MLGICHCQKACAFSFAPEGAIAWLLATGKALHSHLGHSLGFLPIECTLIPLAWWGWSLGCVYSLLASFLGGAGSWCSKHCWPGLSPAPYLAHNDLNGPYKSSAPAYADQGCGQGTLPLCQVSSNMPQFPTKAKPAGKMIC